MPDSSTTELEQLRLLTDRLPDGIVTVAPSGSVIYANAAARRIVHPARLLIGRQLPEICGTFSLQAFARRGFDTRSVPRHEKVTIDDDRTLAFTAIPARNGLSVGLLIEDVSARERRDRARREFVANAAHELLTPLTGIAGAAHVLEAGAKDDPESRDQFISHIAHECSRLARIARGLLVLARARSGEEPPRPEVVELRPVLEDAIDAAGGPVELDCPASLTVFVDRDLAEQAFTNLVANAARHSAGAIVSVVAHVPSNGFVEIEVTDAGPGISSEEFKRVRRRFASGAGRDGGGFGLGISIAAEAIDESGGSLEFASTPGEGTIARVRLPTGRSVHA